MMNRFKALLVVDMQNDFISGALAVKGAEEIIDPIYEKIGQAFQNGWHIIYSKDWHPYSHVSFDINGGIWPIHCLQNSWGAKIVDKLQDLFDTFHAKEILKGLHAEQEQYSAFTQGLKNYLEINRISSLEVCGLAGDYCVKETIKDLKDNGYWVKKLDNLVKNVND